MFNQYFDLESLMATAFRLHTRYSRGAKPQGNGWKSTTKKKEKSDLQKFAVTVDYEIIQE